MKIVLQSRSLITSLFVLFLFAFPVVLNGQCDDCHDTEETLVGCGTSPNAVVYDLTSVVTPSGSNTLGYYNSCGGNGNGGSPSNGSLSDTISAPMTFTPTGSDTRAFIAEFDGTTCVGVTRVTLEAINLSVTVSPSPTATFCPGGSVTLTASVMGNDGSFTSLWTTPGGFSGTKTDPTIDADVAGDYFITVTNNGCMTFSSSVTVSQSALAVSISPSPTATFCPGESVTLTATVMGANGGSFNSDWTTPGGFSGTDDQPTIMANAVGNYTVEIDDGQCVINSTPAVNVSESNLSVSVSPSPSATFCPGESVTLTATVMGANGGSFNSDWTTPGGFSGTDDQPTIMANAAGNYTVEIDDGQCVINSTPAVNVSESNLSVSVSPSPSATFCANSSVELTATVTGANGSFSSDWTTPGGFSGTDNQPSIDANAAGNYVVLINDGECTVTSSPSVNVSQSTLAVSVSPSPSASFCPSSSVTLTATVTGANGGSFSTDWNTPPGFTGTDNQPTIAANRAGNYSVVVGDGECVVTSTPNVNVTENAALNVTVTGDMILCDGEGNTTLTVTQNYSSYIWKLGGTQVATGKNASLPAGNNYTVEVVDASGCTGVSAQFEIEELSPVVITVDGSTNLEVSCSGVCDANINVSVTGGTGPGTYTYAWTGPGFTSAMDDITGLCASTTTDYVLVVTDQEGCTATISREVSTPNPMGSSIIPDDAICDGETNGSVELTVNGGTPGYTFAWSNGSNTPSLTNVGAGTYSVTVTDANGCSITTSGVVRDQDPVVALIAPTNSEICLDKQVTLIASGGTSYNWGAEGTGASITVSPTTSTTYNVVVTDAGAEGCTGSASTTVTVNPLPTAIIAVTETSGSSNNDSEICDGDVVSLNASGGVSYEWSGGGGNPVVYTPLAETTYTVTVTDANGCTATSSETIEVNLNPTAKIDEIAANKTIGAKQIFASGSSGTDGCTIVSCDWNFGNGDSSSACSDNVETTYNSAGAFNISLTVEDNCGCVDTEVQGISIASADDCNIGTFALNGGDPNGCINSDIELVVNRNPSPGNCNLDIDRLVVTPPNSHVFDRENNTIRFSNTGVYTMFYEIEDDCGCGPVRSSTRTITIEELPTAEFALSTIRFCEGTPLVVNLSKSDPTSTVTIEGITSSVSVFGQNPINLNLDEDKEIRIVTVETDLCANLDPSGNTELTIDFIEKFQIDLPEVETNCDDDGNFFIGTFPTIGGNGNLTVLKGNEFISDVNQASGIVTTNELDPTGTYEFIFSRGAFCEPDTFRIDGITCNCTFGVGKMGETDILLCEDAEACAEFVLGTEFNPASDSVVFVLHNKDSGDNLGTVFGVSDEPKFFFQPELGMQLGSAYFISPVGLRGMRSEEDFFPENLSNAVEDNISCLSIERGTLVTWYESPTTTIDGPIEVCQNELDVLFEVDNPVDGSTFEWTVEGLPESSVKQRGNRAFIHFNGNAEIYTVTAVETARYTIGSVTIDCSNTSEFIVSATGEIAPEQTSIVRWPGDIFVATADNVTYNWGVTDPTGTQEIFFGETGKYFFATVGFEEGDQLLFVDIKSDENSSCSTRTYFSTNDPPGFTIPEGQEFAVDLFPNPNSGDFKILLKSNTQEVYNVEIFNGVGGRVHSEQIDKKLLTVQNYVELHGLSSGVYFARVTNQSGSSQITKKIIVH